MMYNDSYCGENKKSYGLLIHGMQKKNTVLAKVWDKLFKSGKGGYNRKRRIEQEKAVLTNS